MNCEQTELLPTPKPVNSLEKVTIVLSGLGPIPSFKNNKMMITKGPSGKPLERPLLITKPEFQQAMKKITDAIVSQCLSAFQIADVRICQESSIRSSIAWSLPADDCWEKIPEIIIRGELCEVGQEGATILIERL